MWNEGPTVIGIAAAATALALLFLPRNGLRGASSEQEARFAAVSCFIPGVWISMGVLWATDNGTIAGLAGAAIIAGGGLSAALILKKARIRMSAAEGTEKPKN